MFKFDQFTAANEAALEQFNQFARLSLAGAEQFAAIGLTASRETLEQVSAHARQVAAARDVQEVLALNAAAVEPALQRARVYSRTAIDAATSAQGEARRAFELRANGARKTAVSALEGAFQFAPAGSEQVVGNLKTALAAAQGAYDQAIALNQQVFDTVEAAVAGATPVAAAKRTTRRK